MRLHHVRAFGPAQKAHPAFLVEDIDTADGNSNRVEILAER